MTSTALTLTKHAVARALDMGVEGHEIKRAMSSRDVRDAGSGCELRTAGRIVLVVNPVERCVVTIMWRYESTRRADVERADDYGRKARRPEHARIRAEQRRTKTRAEKAFDGRRSNRRAESRKKFKEEW